MTCTTVLKHTLGVIINARATWPAVQFLKLALNVEHGDLDPDFWELESDDPYEPEEAYEMKAAAVLELDPSLYVMASGFPMTPEDLASVLNSREFRTKFRTEVLKEPMEICGHRHVLIPSR
jgi:hypothetical protein